MVPAVLAVCRTEVTRDKGTAQPPGQRTAPQPRHLHPRCVTAVIPRGPRDTQPRTGWMSSFRRTTRDLCWNLRTLRPLTPLAYSWEVTGTGAELHSLWVVLTEAWGCRGVHGQRSARSAPRITCF